MIHPDRPGSSWLLREDPEAPEAVFHEPAYRWGKGFVILDAGSFRFDTPTDLILDDDGLSLRHVRPGLELRIDSRFGTSWVESYELINTGMRPVSVGSIAVSTPWRDVYFSVADSLRGGRCPCPPLDRWPRLLGLGDPHERSRSRARAGAHRRHGRLLGRLPQHRDVEQRPRPPVFAPHRPRPQPRRHGRAAADHAAARCVLPVGLAARLVRRPADVRPTALRAAAVVDHRRPARCGGGGSRS